EVADQAGLGGFIPDRLRGGRDAERGGTGPDAGGGPASQRSAAHAGPGPRGPGEHGTGQHGTGQGSVSAGRPGTRPGAATGPDAARRHADPEVVQQVEAQIHLATPLVDAAAELSRWVAWLAPRFSVFGGYLAAEANSLQGYQQLIDRDGPYLGQALGVLGRSLGLDTRAQFGRLAPMRNAVFGLAWDVDLGYPNYFGGWPHHRLDLVAQALPGTGSARLCHEAGAILAHLARDIGRVYGMASRLLDTAQAVITSPVSGYQGQDTAEPWDTHEVAGAQSELAELEQTLAGLADQQGGEGEEHVALDQAWEAALGAPDQHLQQVAGSFR